VKTTIIENISKLTEASSDVFKSTGTKWWFRGQRSAAWGLLPGVRRGYTRLQERYLTNLFYSRAQMRHSHYPAESDYGAWLALMQHYRLPTRLMDWSNSPLIGAYFATKLAFDLARKPEIEDAAIWVLEPHKLNVAMGYEAVFPPLNARSVRPLVRPAFKGADKSNIQVLAVMPIENDMRMFVQQGAFTIHVCDDALDKMPGCDEWLQKFVIPVDFIGGMSRDLDVLGFRLADIFPDLDNLAKEITNMHRPA
jgi:hypothetical protein